ncbi:MAG: histidine kinase [Geitlerinemataceae cyanobacterium]
MSVKCHFIVDGNPAILFASRNGLPEKVLPKLTRLLNNFWDERDTAGEHSYTPECLLAQLVVRFGFEICEDDFSNLRVGLEYDPSVDYLYWIGGDRSVSVWTPQDSYRQDATVGLAGCRRMPQDVAVA